VYLGMGGYWGKMGGIYKSHKRHIGSPLYLIGTVHPRFQPKNRGFHTHQTKKHKTPVKTGVLRHRWVQSPLCARFSARKAHQMRP
jgi:hypothetical protein